MEMSKNVRMSVLLVAALVLVATMAPPATAIRGKVPLLLALRQRGIPVTQSEEAKKIEQELAKIMLEAVAESEYNNNNNNNNALRCIPKYNRCGPAVDGVQCCPPYTCTSQYYGSCS
ncbi:uncharacterized protein LOC110710587 [Chenopodium quinoa]|uniref:uncharacterized protein LOC110710587 n=1 Tax=Chenopodium quinoa TaxID=63459 RepID=UPI000B79516C|nr:uncharacterized protein LOC110710587 [Chenopodium quinoa]